MIKTFNSESAEVILASDLITLYSMVKNKSGVSSPSMVTIKKFKMNSGVEFLINSQGKSQFFTKTKAIEFIKDNCFSV
mgnify:CR=1 FL=1